MNALRLSFIERLTPVVHRIRVNGCSAVDLSWTAQGKLDACIMLANNPWDTSAGALLAREAGAIVFDLEGNDHHIGSTTTVAVAPKLADEFLKALDAATPGPS
ncbi:MAG: inositol monophosphatase family protein [Acidimicrobiales bacterium]